MQRIHEMMLLIAVSKTKASWMTSDLGGEDKGSSFVTGSP
jgi:hypothetical protein